MNLEKWWATQSPEKKKEIDQRATRLDPNTDLYGRSKARTVVKRRPTRPVRAG
jgi:hypothetical protein